MTDHEKLRSLVDDFVDGTLAHEDLRNFEAHLKTCSACAEEVVRTRSLVAQAEKLPRAATPERDLWPDLKTQLQSAPSPSGRVKPPGFGGWFQSWGLGQGLAAAAVLAMVVAGVFLVTSRSAIVPDGREIPTAEVTDPDAPTFMVVDESGRTQSATFAAMIWALEKESMGVEKALVAALQTGPSSLTFDGAEAIDQSLSVLDRAITESADALRADPENPELVKRVTGYYRQRLSLLQKTTRLASQSIT